MSVTEAGHEEAAVRKDLRARTIYHAQLEGAQTGSDELRRLRVPGLPEGRPSLALGDAVLVTWPFSH